MFKHVLFPLWFLFFFLCQRPRTDGCVTAEPINEPRHRPGQLAQCASSAPPIASIYGNTSQAGIVDSINEPLTESQSNGQLSNGSGDLNARRFSGCVLGGHGQVHPPANTIRKLQSQSYMGAGVKVQPQVPANKNGGAPSLGRQWWGHLA